VKLLLVATRNPHFPTVTEYIERACRGLGHDVIPFDDRDFVFPGRLRARVPGLTHLDLAYLNRRLAHRMRHVRPDLVLCAGGERILPGTIQTARHMGAVTVLWTIDAVKPNDPRVPLAPHFDFVFCGGTEMVEALQGCSLRHGPHWLPFACDSELHHPVPLTARDRDRYRVDIAFVGSLHASTYRTRLSMLEALADLDLGIWGPGAFNLPLHSPAAPRVRGGETGYEVWTRIYSAARIVLCAHYSGPGPRSRQASPRVFEALACGALLLCDDCPDVTVLFEPARELLVFHDTGDLREKARYYLEHEGFGAAIARRGRDRVLAAHTYRHRVQQLLETVASAQ
jgi:spore maturation protein CgeB